MKRKRTKRQTRARLRSLARTLPKPTVVAATDLPQPELERMQRLVAAFDEALEHADPVVARSLAELDAQANRELPAAIDRLTASFDRVVTLANAAGERRIDALANEQPVVTLDVLAEALIARIDGETRQSLRDSAAALRRTAARGPALSPAEHAAVLDQLGTIRKMIEGEVAEARAQLEAAEHQLATWRELVQDMRELGHAVLLDGATERADEWVSRVSETEVVLGEYRRELAEIDALGDQLVQSWTAERRQRGL